MMHVIKSSGAIYQKFTIVIVLLGCALLSACATKVVKEEEYSGFLNDYTKLKKVNVLSDDVVFPTLRWINPVLATRDYHKIMLDPVVIYPAARPGPQLRLELLTRMLAYLNKELQREVGKKYVIVKTPGRGVARIRAAITGVRTNPQQLAVYEYVPIALVLAGVSTATGMRDESVEIFAEMEMFDSLSQEDLAMGVRKGFGEPIEGKNEYVEFENVRPVLDSWVQALVKFLDATMKSQHHTIKQ